MERKFWKQIRVDVKTEHSNVGNGEGEQGKMAVKVMRQKCHKDSHFCKVRVGVRVII